MADKSQTPKSQSNTRHGTSAELFTRYQGGDDEAAEEIFARYLERLTRLARSSALSAIGQPDRSRRCGSLGLEKFFPRRGAGKFALRRGGDLWRLLASITLHKVYRHARRHTAERRSVNLEQPLEGTQDFPPVRDREPTPEEALAIADELKAVMTPLDAFERRVLELRLQGETLTAIAADTGRSERTVRRTLAHLRERLARRFEVASDG